MNNDLDDEKDGEGESEGGPPGRLRNHGYPRALGTSLMTTVGWGSRGNISEMPDMHVTTPVIP